MAIQSALCPILVGREEELSLLEDAMLAANRGQGQAVMLAREAGLGKTRLAIELQKRAGKLGTAVMWGGCSEAELALPYLPFVEAIGNYLTIADVESLRKRLGHACRELAQLFPQLEPAPLPRGDVPESKLRLYEAIVTLLCIPAAERGLLLVIEDLHWADSSTRELLHHLIRRLRNSRILVLGTYRSDELHRKHPLLPMVQGWRRAGLARVVELKPLSRDGVSDMIHAILDQPVDAKIRDFLYATSEGNPFVLEELLKAALDRGDIYRTRSGWDWKALSELKLPQTVRDTILLRVERLGEDQAEVLRCAAVLGRSFAYRMLVSLCDREEVVVHALQVSIQQQLVEEEPQARGGRYRFRHALTREAIYEDLIAPKRQDVHARAAQVLRELPDTPAVDLAYHLLAARQWDQAIPVCIKAAEEAERRRGYREAAELFRRALPHLNDKLMRSQILCRLGNAHLLAGDLGKAQPYLEEGVELLEQSEQTAVAARYRLALGRCHWQRSRPDLARAEYERARMALEPQGPSEDLATAYMLLATLHVFEHESGDALRMAERAAAVAEAAGSDVPRIWAYTFIGSAMAALGRVSEGLEYMDRSYQQAVERGLDWIAENAAFNTIVILWQNFRAQETLPRMRLLRALEVGGGRQDLWAAYLEGSIQVTLGDPSKARRALDLALGLAQTAENSTFVSWIERDLAYVHGALGNFAEARRLLPKRGTQRERQSALRLLLTAIRILVDTKDIEQAAREAESVFQAINWSLHLQPREVLVVDHAVEAFLKAGRTQEAEALVARIRTADMDAGNPHRARMEGRLALAHGDLERARQRLTEAAEFFHRVFYREEEWRSRRVLAEVKAGLGDRTGAETDLRAILGSAEQRGAVFETQAAREQLASLGIEIEPGRAVEQPDTSAAELRHLSERLVTVMFIDVRGYTAMTAREPPQAIAEKLASLHRWSRQEVESHHGIVDKYTGDAVMATFNVSGMRLDHCLHALQAAIAIRDKAAYHGLPVGTGVAVGPAIVGQLTAGANITAVGEAINLAARLQAQAEADEILLSEEAFRRVRHWLAEQNVAPEGETLVLKGFAAPVTAYRLRARVAGPSRT